MKNVLCPIHFENTTAPLETLRNHRKLEKGPLLTIFSNLLSLGVYCMLSTSLDVHESPPCPTFPIKTHRDPYLTDTILNFKT